MGKEDGLVLGMRVAFEHAKISPDELDNPEWVSPTLIDHLARIRRRTESPILYTISPDGTPRHPHGDAVPGDSPHHVTRSFHKFGIDHYSGKVSSHTMACAVDVDCPGIPLRDFYWFAEIEMPGGGIGIYPHWHNPGLHIDVRPSDHYASGARWWRDRYGGYHQLHPGTLMMLMQEGLI